MKIILKIGIKFAICWLSTCIERVLPFAMPASIIGMALLLVCLFLRVIRPELIREKTDFLLENLPFFFVPAGVSIIQYMDVLKSSLMALAVICVVTMVITFAATVWAVRLVLRLMERKK